MILGMSNTQFIAAAARQSRWFASSTAVSGLDWIEEDQIPQLVEDNSSAVSVPTSHQQQEQG